MLQSEEKYISLLTDFGFKRIFGTAPNKDLLINFLNSLFDGEQVIKDVTYLNSEYVGDIYTERKAIFDVYCENERGEKFIVEMQNAFQQFFMDLSPFYADDTQEAKGLSWKIKFEHVYIVLLKNYDMRIKSFAQNDKVTYKYVDIAKFNKSEGELVTLYDKWLYLLCNLSRLDERPTVFSEEVFTHLFEQAEIAKLSPAELREYAGSVRTYRDLKNSLDTAYYQGIAEGLAQVREERRKKEQEETRARIAKKLKESGMSAADISKSTGLSAEEISKL